MRVSASKKPDVHALRPIYTEKLTGVAAHDSLFYCAQELPCTSAQLPDAAKQRITPGYSCHVLSVDCPL